MRLRYERAANRRRVGEPRIEGGLRDWVVADSRAAAAGDGWEGWEVKTYRIKVQLVNGKREPFGEPVEGKGLGLLAVTPLLEVDRSAHADAAYKTSKRRARNLTHIPTGIAIREFANQADALASLARFVEAADWQFFKNNSADEPKIGEAYKALKAAKLL